MRRAFSGSGTQFDPRFAKIMLQMIDEDPDYTMIGQDQPENEEDPEQ